MKVTVKLFAIAKQFAGNDQVELELGESANVESLRQELLSRLPELKPMQDSLRFAVNSEYADDSTTIAQSDEVACIPPVSGG